MLRGTVPQDPLWAEDPFEGSLEGRLAFQADQAPEVGPLVGALQVGLHLDSRNFMGWTSKATKGIPG